jgi:MFS family permease
VIDVDDLSSTGEPGAVDALRSWSRRRLLVAAVAAVLVALAIGLPTDVIPNPVFGRPVPVTWWSYPTLLITAVLGGLLAATYVGPGSAAPVSLDDMDAPTRRGGMAGMLSFFAVGCPVCNKLVVVALGTTGARQWFEPLQPALAVASIVLLAWALRARLRSATVCSI